MPADAQACFDQKVALQQSAGLMPKVPASLTERERKLLYYSTTSSDTMTWKPIPESMNFSDIHNIGKKDTKYYKYKVSTAPFWPRSLCRYTQDYVELPLGDSVINTELAKTFRPKQMRSISAPSFVKVTKYKDDYQSYPGSKPPGSYKPQNPMHVDLKSQLLEKQCRTHDEYPMWHGAYKSPKEEEIRPSRWDLRVNHPTLGITRYCEDYSRDRRMAKHGPPSRIEDESTRVMGASVPARVRDVVFAKNDHKWSRKEMDSIPSVTELLRMKDRPVNPRAPQPPPVPGGDSLDAAARQ